MDDIRDQMAISNEIGEAIARPAFGNEIDEDELREELEQLEQEELDHKLVGVEVPTQKVPIVSERRTAFSSDPTNAQNQRRNKSRRRKKTKRPNYVLYRQKWPFNAGPMRFMQMCSIWVSA